MFGLIQALRIGDAEVLVAHSLESWGLAVDPVHKRLVPLVVASALQGK